MITDYYKSNYIVYTHSGSYDSAGDYTEVETVALTGKCKLQAQSGQYALRLTDKGEVYSDYRAYMAPVDIDEYKSIRIDGKDFNIVFIANRMSRHLELDLRSINET